MPLDDIGDSVSQSGDGSSSSDSNIKSPANQQHERGNERNKEVVVSVRTLPDFGEIPPKEETTEKR